MKRRAASTNGTRFRVSLHERIFLCLQALLLTYSLSFAFPIVPNWKAPLISVIFSYQKLFVKFVCKTC